MVEDAITWKNDILKKGGISEHLSTIMFVLVTPLDYDKHRKFEFGSYAKVVRETNLKNEMHERTNISVILRNTMEIQGGYRVMILKT